MNIEKIKLLKNQYKENFESIHLDEIYKWHAFKCFQDNWGINSNNFHEMLTRSFERSFNLLDSGNYFPKLMLLSICEKEPNKVQNLFKNLIDEDNDYLDRIGSFQLGIKELNEELYPGKNSYQDHRAIVTYLSLIYPDTYFLYKYSMFCDFIKSIDHTYKPIMGRIENIGQFIGLCRIIREELIKDQELVKMHKTRIDDDCYFDTSFNLLTQDFIYAVARHLNLNEIAIDSSMAEVLVSELSISNIITTEGKSSFNPSKSNLYYRQKKNKRIGDLGEYWTVEFEKNRLLDAGLIKQSEKVEHTSVEKGDGAGYDIKSFDIDKNEIFIEVKTTTGSCEQIFFITRTELSRSKKERDKYRLYRVYNFDQDRMTAKLAIFKGDLSPFCEMPETYRTKVRN